MRLHHLTMTAFGPFAGTETVDFDTLNDAGLFLLHGPTGAGKTSILDAVCFALFGKVPGVRHHAGRLTSDHAQSGSRTSVTLAATLQGRCYRVTRRPKQEVPKVRGTGTRIEQASVLLEEWRGDRWVTRSTRNDEAGAELTRLVGLTAEQFFQVVLLPQGGFARFLHAKAEERADLLGRLFDTDRFERAQQWLEDQRRQHDRAVDEIRERLDVGIALAAQAAGLPGTDPAAVRAEGVVAWLDGLAERVAAHAVEARTAAALADDAQRSAAAAHAAAADLARRLERRREAERQLVALRERAATVRATEERLAAHDRAAVARPAVAALTGQEERTHGAEAAVARATAQVRGLGIVLPDALTSEPTAELAERARTEAEALRPVAELEQALFGRAAALDRDRAEADRLAHEVARLDAELGALPVLRAEADAEKEAALAAAASLPGLQQAEQDTRTRHDALLALGRARSEAEAAGQAERTAREQWVAAREDAVALRERWVAGMAGELAGSLEDGRPCPVCGSDEHPRPATAPPDAVTKARVAAAERAVEDALVRLDAARGLLAELRTRVAGLDGIAGEMSDVAASAEAVRAATARREEAQALADLLPAAQGAIEALNGRATELNARRTGLVQRQAAAARAVADAAAALVRDGALVAAARGDEPSVDRALRVRLEGAAALATLATALRALATERDALATARSVAAAAAVEAGFVHAQAVLAATLRQADLDRQRQAVRQHADALATVRAVLAEPELAGLDLHEVPDVAGLAAHLRTAQETARVATGAAALAAGRVDTLRGAAEAVRSAMSRLEPAEQRRATVRGLANLVAGNAPNRLKMRLEVFVLAARLEAVAEAASSRLLAMTGGRYRLSHVVDTKGNGRKGLELQVFDAWTMQARDTATLSGGETFLASLALALGLADVVQADVGGLALDTLFIDEGFGSLDPDTLEEVMAALDGLREGGRVVGVVSHVAEMQQRFTHRVTVQRHHDGSRVLQAV